MTRDDSRAKCINLIAKAAAGSSFWNQMPESGRNEMRKEAKRIVEAIDKSDFVRLVFYDDSAEPNTGPATITTITRFQP